MSFLLDVGLRAMMATLGLPKAADPQLPDTIDTAGIKAYRDTPAEYVAAKIVQDMFDIGSLEAQRAILGDALIAPLPLSSLVVSDHDPVLALELLAYEGSFAAFSRALQFSTAGRAQLRHVVALTQASGGGKTKLAYAEGMSESLVIVSRIALLDGSLTPPWEAYVQLARELESARARASFSERQKISETASAALRLLVASYAEWVAMVLTAFLSLRDGIATKSQLQEAALRCLQNRHAEEAVASLLSKRLAEMGRLSSAGVKELSDETAMHHTAAVAVRLSSLLWSGATVTIWYDDAHKLLPRRDDVDAPPEGMFPGLICPMSSLLHPPVSWRQVICGPSFELPDAAGLADFSRARERVSSFHHASTMDETDMARSLSRYFAIGPESLPDSTITLLRRLRGRPLWFFDHFWPSLWRRIGGPGADWSSVADRGRDGAVPSTAPAIAYHIEAAARDAIASSEAHALKMVSCAWGNAPQLCLELYAAIKMNGGEVHLTAPSATIDAMRFGILVLQPSPLGGPVSASLSDEPCMVAAIEAKGDSVVYELRHNADDDPVYQLLLRSMRLGHVSSFDLTTSVKGPALELLFVWNVLRSRIGNGGLPAPLSKILEPFLLLGCLPTDTVHLVAHSHLTATRARNMHGAAFEYAAWPADSGTPDVILFGVDHEAGANIAFAVEDSRSGARRLVLVQAKAHEEASLANCLRASTPAWQYTTEPQRTRVLSNVGESTATSAKRLAFQDIARANAAVFEGAIRISFCVNDFGSDTVRDCCAVNAHSTFGLSPVLLCSLQASLLESRPGVPRRLAYALVESCKLEGHSTPVVYPTSTFEKAFWIPFNIATVAQALDASTRERATAEVQRLIGEAVAILG